MMEALRNLCVRPEPRAATPLRRDIDPDGEPPSPFACPLDSFRHGGVVADRGNCVRQTFAGADRHIIPYGVEDAMLTGDCEIAEARAEDIGGVLDLQERNQRGWGGRLSARLTPEWLEAAVADIPVVVAKKERRVVSYPISALLGAYAGVPVVAALRARLPSREEAPRRPPARVLLVHGSSFRHGLSPLHRPRTAEDRRRAREAWRRGAASSGGRNFARDPAPPGRGRREAELEPCHPGTLRLPPEPKSERVRHRLGRQRKSQRRGTHPGRTG